MFDSALFNLKYVNRYSGVRLITSESDVDHTYDMCIIALTDLVDLNNKSQSIGESMIDIQKLIYKITIHDLGEALTTDIPRPFKYSTPELKREVDRAEELLLRKELSSNLVKDIKNAKDDSLEGIWVKLLDFIQAGLKMVDEIKLGNTYMKTQLPNVIGALKDNISLLNNLVHRTYIRDVVKYFNDYLK